ncbi:protein MpBHLH31 [Marchantia polymorpha subsp. ruderalis]|uniref:BHLH domain-containing protein n=1 Tax=Marchantia polymorpha TaxID=3197 RepID=A0A2R6VZM4_MARPO|nr:hypothetical protein MARPO_0232s0001 [Marchantia polymorpha]BBN01398.1 hypothetical protein Mp_2g07110 [Marchantia polymorpha subsp. ruderalis]|eukprot:PTQ27051.1 hypothetical protein MARPO_0232s0001 [Marchantia polymorpha]
MLDAFVVTCHKQMIPWTDLGRVRCNNAHASFVHAITAHFEADRQLTCGMGMNKVQIGNGRTPTVFTPWTSHAPLEATSFVAESGTYSQPTYAHGGAGDSWPSFTFSPEQIDYRQAPVSVPESSPSTPPLLYDTVTLGPIIDCSGVADLILDKGSTPFFKDKEKETTPSARIILPAAAASVTGNATAIPPKLQLGPVATQNHASVATDCQRLLQLGKDDQVKKSDLLSAGANWEFSERVPPDPNRNQASTLDKEAKSKASTEQRKIATMHEGYLKNYKKDRLPNVVTLQKSDHMRRERDRRIALKLMYKTLDSMIPKPSKKSKRDRTAIVDDALKYVKGMQEKLEKFRLKGIGVKKISTISNRLLEPEHENLLACSPAELPSRLGKLTAATGAAREQGTEISVITSHDERLGSDSSLLMEPQVQVFIGCGNDVLISFSCKPRGNLISCVLQALEMFCLEVKQYTFSKILKELVHCNFMTKHNKASGDTPSGQMIEDVLKSLLK